MIDPPLPMSVESAKLGQEASAAPPIPVWVAMAAPEKPPAKAPVKQNIEHGHFISLIQNSGEHLRWRF